jgi:hypothetical protein
MMTVIFFLNACKKEGVQQGPGTSQNVKEIIAKNLSWDYDSAGKKAFVNVTVPANYSVDSISGVYRLFSFFNEWIKVLKDGTEKDIFYYTILNGKLVLYYIFEINNPDTDVQYLITDLNGICNTIRVDLKR